MRAALLTRLNEPLELVDLEPCALEYGQVLVRVLASGICGAQLQEIAGNKGNAKFLPHPLGHEGCGIVEAVGIGVSRMKVGDKVVMHWRKASGIESPFPRYRWNGREIQGGKVTTFSQFSICSENRLTPVPHDTPTELCALLGCGLSTALATIERDAAIRFGESVLIIGCGGLGANLIRAAKLAHASPIVCVDVHESKRRISREMGADAFVNCSTDSISSAKVSCSCGFDVVIDTAGARKSIEAGLQMMAPSGRFVMVGQPKPNEVVEISNANHLFGGEGKTIRATQGGGFRPDEDIPRFIKLWKSGALSIESIITHRFGLEEINRGIDAVRNGEASRVLVEM